VDVGARVFSKANMCLSNGLKPLADISLPKKLTDLAAN